MNTTSNNQVPLNPEQSVALEADAATMARRYVRVTSRSGNGFVNFEYAVGWPDMSVELALPEDLFADFCIKNNVQFLDEPVENKLGEHDE